MSQQQAKLAAAKQALSFVEPGMVVGLGSGSTATLFIQELGKRVADGLDIRGIASSDDSERLARELGIPITDFTHHSVIDVAVDGADEIGPDMAVIKGGGGKLLREKIVASAAKRFILVADDTKLVRQLGKFPLPVEVIPMAVPLVAARLRELGFTPTIRPAKEGAGPYLTDEGNLLLDCTSAGIAHPVATAAAIRSHLPWSSLLSEPILRHRFHPKSDLSLECLSTKWAPTPGGYIYVAFIMNRKVSSVIWAL